MMVLINIPKERFADIQRIASVQIERRVPSVEQIIANGTPIIKPERKTGKWIDDCECSVCHWINEDDGGDTLLTYYNYCPNCGAKMDGGEQE